MGMIGYAEILVNRDFTVLMPDARAHGASGGAIASFGLLEADDIHRWLSWVQEREHPKCIYGLGESMGAAQLLQSLALEPRFCAAVAESPFASFREIAYDRIGQFFHTGSWLGRSVLRPVVEIAFWYSRRKYGFDFEKVSPEVAVATSQVPILLIHGRDDRNIPVRHSRAIALENPNLPLWEVPGADHCGAINVAEEEFERRVVGWFEEHTGAGRPITRVKGAMAKQFLALLRLNFARRDINLRFTDHHVRAVQHLSRIVLSGKMPALLSHTNSKPATAPE